jgi:predicted DNA-binding protein (MmcQ/YjbR family)
MTFDSFRNFCLSFRGVTEETPFDERTLVYKVMGKMFALTDLHNFDAINLKCDPEKALELREQYESVKAGYHMNKKHWNTIALGGDASDGDLYEWIRHSYELVYAALPKKLKEALAAIE